MSYESLKIVLFSFFEDEGLKLYYFPKTEIGTGKITPVYIDTFQWGY